MSEHQEQQHVSSKVYLFVFLLLCGCTVASWLVDEIEINSVVLLIVSVLAIATLKAGCVVLYFMHLKFERNWKYVLLLPTICLALGLPVALLPDISLNYYTNVTPQAQRVAADPGDSADQGTEADAATSTDQPSQ